MNLYLRLLMVLIAAFFKPRIHDILHPARLRFRVLPNDLDINGHMNNGRYPSVMDLGRLDLVMRTGLLRLMLREKSVPVLAAFQMRFRIPLHAFQLYELETRVVCWDKKWVYMEQRFIMNDGDVAAIGIVKGGFYDRSEKSMIPTQTLLDVTGATGQSPAFPAHIREWIEAEEALRAVTRR